MLEALQGYDTIIIGHDTPVDRSAIDSTMTYVKRAKEIHAAAADAKTYSENLKPPSPTCAGRLCRLSASYLYAAPDRAAGARRRVWTRAAPIQTRRQMFSSWLTASNKRVDVMGDEVSSLSNDGRIATEKSGHIFLIVIDRPEKLNGFSVKMLSELGQAFSAMEDDSDIRCGVLCAEVETSPPGSNSIKSPNT